MMDSIWQDIRFGTWLLYKNKKWTAVIVLCLGLGIGPNATLFSLINMVMVRPIDAHRADRLVRVNSDYSQDGEENYSNLSYPDFRDIQTQTETLEATFLDTFRGVTAVVNGVPETRRVGAVTSNFFDCLGRKPLMGETFHGQKVPLPGSLPEMVLSHRFWSTVLASDPDIVGKQIRMNSFDFTVVAVMSETFMGTNPVFPPDFWVPVVMISYLIPADPGRLEERDHNWTQGYGRLKDGVTLEQANAEMNAIGLEVQKNFPEAAEGRSFAALPFLPSEMVGGGVILLLLVGLVLLVACTSVAAMMLARATERRTEIAVRLALGASRKRLIGQLLVESMLLGLLAGLVGLLMALWALDLIPAMTSDLPFSMNLEASIDWRVLLYTLSISLLAGIVFGLVPALQATKAEVFPALKDAPLAADSQKQTTAWRNAFVVAQFSMSVLLLIYAALFIRSQSNINSLDPGFDADHLAVFRVALSQYGYSGREQRQFVEQLSASLSEMPGVQSVSLTRAAPLNGDFTFTRITPVNENLESGNQVRTGYASVDPGFFKTLGLALVKGREFTEADRGQPLVIVNETMAELLWPGQDPLGQMILGNPEGIEVIGVAKDSVYTLFTSEQQHFYYRMVPEDYRHATTFLIRTTDNAETLLKPLAGEISAIHAGLSHSGINTMNGIMETAKAPNKALAGLFTALGALAMLLALIGVYGVVSYTVSLRRQEVGIRLTLGGQPAALILMLMKKGLVLIGIATLIGLGLSAALSQLEPIQKMMIGLDPLDPVTYIVVLVFLLTVAAVAIFIPARRTTTMDPMRALKYE